MRSGLIGNAPLIGAAYAGGMPHALASLPQRSLLTPPPTDLAARYDVSVDASRDLVRYVMAGFFDAASVDELRARQAEVMRDLHCLPNGHLTILDISGCKIQSQAVMRQFATMLHDRRRRARSLAVVVGGSLARMQITRILERADVAFFATAAEAEAWLFPGDAGSAGADRLAD